MIKILITGGAGFIGSSLVHRLCTNKDIQICILDNLCTGYIQNIEDVIKYENVQFLKSDIRDTRLVKFIQDNK